MKDLGIHEMKDLSIPIVRNIKSHTETEGPPRVFSGGNFINDTAQRQVKYLNKYLKSRVKGSNKSQRST
jgi:hypothetical protein